jgi:hypothetical protein
LQNPFPNYDCGVSFPESWKFLSMQCMDAETCSLRCILKQCFQETNEAILKKLQVWVRV